MSTRVSAEEHDYSIDLLRQLRDVLIVARGTKLYGHRALLVKDPFFAAMLKTDKKEYHIAEDPTVIKARMKKVYFEPCTNEVLLRPNVANRKNKVGARHVCACLGNAVFVMHRATWKVNTQTAKREKRATRLATRKA